jgi:hypothetical protein
MKRIIKGALFNINGSLYYEDRLFSGIAYELQDEQIVQPFLVKNGVIGAPHLSPHVDDRADLAHVDLSEVLSDYELPEYQGAPFTGVAYAFLGDYCNREVRLDEGNPVLDTWWDRDGTLIGYERNVSSFGEIYAWYPSGALKSFEISTNSSYTGYVTLSENGQLEKIGSRKGFISSLGAIAASSPYFPVSDFAQVLAYRAAAEVSILGGDFNDEVIGKMFAAGMFAETQTIELIDTALTAASLPALQGCSQLKKIVIRKMDDGRKQALAAVAAANPRVQVEFK